MNTNTSIYDYTKENLETKTNKTAIWFYGNSITYSELFERIDNVANNLLKLGVKPRDVITVHVPNCPEEIIAIYAIAKVGAISNIVHPLTPLKALKENMQKTNSRFLITSNVFRDAEKVDFADKVFCIRMSSSMGLISKVGLEFQSKFCFPKLIENFTVLEKPCNNFYEFPNPKGLADECACYMHSSGSTGTPKTVMHSHKSINNWSENYRIYRKESGLTDDPISSSFLPMFHGAGLAAGMHTQLSSGWKIILTSKMNIKQILRFIRKRKISDIIAVPSMYAEFLKQKSFNKHTTKNIRNYYVGADTMPVELKQKILEKSNENVNGIFELYGMSETVLGCFMTNPEHNNLSANGYCHSYPGCEIAVINDNIINYRDAEGELVVSTNTMMMGYLNDEKATNETVFEYGGKRWIRSGDYGRIDKDGYVYFKYRIKNVIVRKGMNVFPDEVEKCIKQLEFVKDVCVVGPVNKETGSQFVRACVILKDGVEQSENIRQKIKEQVSTNMLKHCTPEEIIFVSEFPKLGIGKIDTVSLKE